MEEVQSATFLGEPVRVLLEESGSERWLRPPRGEPGGQGGWGRGSGQAYALVAAPPGRLVWIEAMGIVAYHPADTVVWFRSRAACVAAQAGQARTSPPLPRAPLPPGRGAPRAVGAW